jgi:hypothetical protein
MDETLANLSITGHLRGFPDQQLRTSSSAASQLRKASKINHLQIERHHVLLSG